MKYLFKPLYTILLREKYVSFNSWADKHKILFPRFQHNFFFKILYFTFVLV
jgi:hypothetical protein